MRCCAGVHRWVPALRCTADEALHRVRDTVSPSLPLHRRLQARFRRTRPQRLLLAFMRRPAGQPDHVEGGADAAVGIGKALGVDLRHPQHRGAAGRRAPPLDQDIGRAHPPEILHQRKRAVVAHHDAIDVGDRQREAGALQQRADIAQIGERRDARRHAALAFGFGGGKGLPQLGQRIAADHRRQQQPVGPQRAADLRQHARQIVDELERKRGDGEIERFRLQRQRFRSIGIDAGDRSGNDPRAAFAAIRPASRFRRRRQNSRVTACSRSAMSSATRSSRNVTGPARRARSSRARSSARSNRTGAAVGFEAMAGWYAACPVHGNHLRLSGARAGASLAPWTPRHHHHAPSPAICAAR